MLTPEQLDAYLDGSLDAAERARVEQLLAGDAAARRQVLEQRAMDHALRATLGGEASRDRVKQSVLAVVRGQTLLKLKARVLHDMAEQKKVLPLPLPPRRPERKRNGSFGWAAGLAAAACFAVAAWWFFPARVAELADVTHQVEVKRFGVPLSGREQFVLRRGDVIRVKENSAVAVRYADGTLLPLAAGAEVKMGGGDGKRVHVSTGTLAARVAKQSAGEALVISTTDAEVRVVGTEFALAVESGRTRLTMDEGVVKFARAGGTALDVKAGEMAVAAAASGINVTPSARDPHEWPFSVDSPWNRPLGRGASFVPMQTPAPIFPVTGVLRTVRVTMAKGGDPMHRILQQNRARGSALMPDEFLGEGAADGANVLAAPTHDFVWELFGARRTQGDATANFAQRGSLTGTGFGAEWATMPGRFASALGGAIRRNEATTGIRHALAFMPGSPALSLRAPGGKPSVWPAAVSASGLQASLFGTNGNLHFGSLLALPPSVDLRALGFGASGPGFEIARALQDYGAYVAGTGPKPLMVAVAADASLPPEPELDRIFNKLLPRLQIVANNSPATPGGGGEPRRAAAPPLRTGL
ncbi:MAG: FecR domain-containing protein [Verrucomicrobia bacterium]|nr:FecR domain-containing protein [Verrucomicrobiota bacterium]